MNRKVKIQATGYPTKDGAGVSLVRVLGHETAADFDPILMLDSFDSLNPDDYTAGFPMHPHRGIETVSYVYKGQMIHKDSLGHTDAIGDGQVQWMTAGSGILHEELLPASPRMMGVQLWLNLPAKDKMANPAYLSVKEPQIKNIPIDGGTLRLLVGRYEDQESYISKYLPLDYYDIHMEENRTVTIDTDEKCSVMVFTLSGEVSIEGQLIKEKTAASLTSGTKVEIKSGPNPAQVLFIRSTPLNEPIAMGGPVVMNTREELAKAFEELENGTFIKHETEYDHSYWY